MLTGGARWAVEAEVGQAEDLERIEEGGCMKGAISANVSDHAKERQRREMRRRRGALGAVIPAPSRAGGHDRLAVAAASGRLGSWSRRAR